MDSLVSVDDVDWGVVDSPELGEVVASGMSTITSRFSLLNPWLSPVSMVCVPQIVVESPTSYEAAVGSKDACPAADWVVPRLPQESQVFQCRLCSYRPTGCRRTIILIPWMCSRCMQLHRGTTDISRVSPISTPNALSKPGSPVHRQPVI